MENALKQKNKVLRLSQLFFFWGVFFKQFYLLPSGGLQVGDIIFMCSFCLLVLSGRMRKNMFATNNFLYVVFLSCIISINLMCFVAYESTSFILSTMYYIYNFVVMYTFLQHMEREGFLKGFSNTIKFTIMTQLIIYICNLGRWYLGYRYMGTFNDPNQFAFFIFAALLILAVLEFKKLKKSTYISVAISIFLILKSASTGALLGVIVLFGGYIIVSTRDKKKLLYTFFAICLIIILISSGIINQLPEFVTSSEAYVRLVHKFDKFGLGGTVDYSSSLNALLNERGWYRLVEYPEKMIFGVGEGKLSRFGGNLEIHSSILGILFYYGVFPTSCLTLWILKKFKRIDKAYTFIYLAFLVEVFFLNNTRQPFFWILLILLDLGELKINNDGRNEERINEI